jgi:hypothetical protein
MLGVDDLNSAGGDGKVVAGTLQRPEKIFVTSHTDSDNRPASKDMVAVQDGVGNQAVEPLMLAVATTQSRAQEVVASGRSSSLTNDVSVNDPPSKTACTPSSWAGLTNNATLIPEGISDRTGICSTMKKDHLPLIADGEFRQTLHLDLQTTQAAEWYVDIMATTPDEEIDTIHVERAHLVPMTIALHLHDEWKSTTAEAEAHNGSNISFHGWYNNHSDIRFHGRVPSHRQPAETRLLRVENICAIGEERT